MSNTAGVLSETRTAHPSQGFTSGFFGVVHVAHLFSFLCFLFCLSSLYVRCQMLSITLDCPFLIAHLILSNIYIF